MTDEDLELRTLMELVCEELSSNGCVIIYTGLPCEGFRNFPAIVCTTTDVVFRKDNLEYDLILNRRVRNDTSKQFDFDMDVEYTLMEDQIPPLSSLNIGDNITIERKTPDGVELRIQHGVSSGIVAECETKYSDDAEIAAVAKAIAARVITEMNKIQNH